MSEQNSQSHDMELMQEIWEANAGAWTQVVRESRIESRRIATNSAIVSLLLKYSPKRLLDVGCGEGWLGRALSLHGMEIVGIDGSSELIARSQELGGGRFLELTYAQAIANPERMCGLYDAIACNFSLLEEKIVPLLRTIQTQLNDDGHVFIQTIHPLNGGANQSYVDGWRLENFASFDIAFPQPMSWYFRTISSWLNLLQESGLTLVETNEPVHPESLQPLSIIFICQQTKSLSTNTNRQIST
jgi:2-polyprenyl-3-methyl-5-hydroxy-6-metoxy-1,4-benzoquinol methylase